MLGVLAAGWSCAAPAVAAGRTPSQRLGAEVRRAVAPAGSRASVLVRAGSRTLVDVRSATRRPLGSTTKLFTAAAVLKGFVPRLTTAAVAGAPIGAGGVLDGDLGLLGGGDPSLGTLAFATSRGLTGGTNGLALADRLVALGLREVRGAVVGDERVFDAVRGGPASGGVFDAELDGVLGGLTWNRGRAGDGGTVLEDPARGAAVAFDDALEARGVVVRGVPRAGAAPAGAVLATLETPATRLVKEMVKRSDDLYAEALVKGLGARRGAGTTAAGVAAVQAVTRRLGVAPRLADGSGLPSASRGSTRDLVGLLTTARRRPWGTALFAALPVAGRDGTLAKRLRSIRGRCKAKTGNLGARVSALAGTCRTRRGTTLTFAVQVEGQPLARGTRLVDAVALALARSKGV